MAEDKKPAETGKEFDPNKKESKAKKPLQKGKPKSKGMYEVLRKYSGSPELIYFDGKELKESSHNPIVKFRKAEK